MGSWSIASFLMQITIWLLDLGWKSFRILLKDKGNIVISVSTEAEPNGKKKKANNAFCRSFGLLKEKSLPHITINYVSNYRESFVITDIKVDPEEMTKLIFCKAGVWKAVKGNWKQAFYLTLAIKLKKEFQKSQNYIRVGRFCTQNDDIIFEPSVKSDSKDFQTRVAGSGNIIRHFILALMQG